MKVHFKIKEEYFKKHLTENTKYKLLVSEGENIAKEDKEFVTNYLKNEK